MSSTSDATAAYRGYRLQTLYSLNLILSQITDKALVFQPEGKEDLAVYNGEHHLLEIIQVKDRSQNLSLSTFEPDKKDSFFYRVAREIHNKPDVAITIAAFGNVGPEFLKAVNANGSERIKIANKLADYGFLTKVEV